MTVTTTVPTSPAPRDAVPRGGSAALASPPTPPAAPGSDDRSDDSATPAGLGADGRVRPAGAPDDGGSPARPALRVSAPPRPAGPAGYPEASTRPSPRPRRVRIGTPGVRRAPAADEEPTPRPLREAAPAALPDPTAQCCTVVRAAVEVLRGERPAAQLARWVTPQVRDQLAERARIGLAHDLVRTEEPHRPVQVRRVRLVRLGEDVAEATVVLEDDGRVRAAAVRLEARRGTWRVAVLEVG
ncbi:Rv3235 family protein [Isoptericola sp. NPDC019693]|uniref:Rv3235 family protein n=1 Tax=Isoptericola sp. NPDC019693 TaxID=3364009 RepID=UPI0037A63643